MEWMFGVVGRDLNRLNEGNEKLDKREQNAARRSQFSERFGWKEMTGSLSSYLRRG
jgi:hypothetical protein